MKSLLFIPLLFSTSVFANTATTAALIIMSSGTTTGGGSVTYQNYDVKINIEEVKDTGTCHSLWDDSNKFRQDDLELAFKIQNNYIYFPGKKSDTTTTKGIKSIHAQGSTVEVTHKDYLLPNKVTVEIIDIDPLRNDQLGSFEFDYKDVTAEFDTDCVKGEIQMTNQLMSSALEKITENLSIGDKILFKCADPILANYQGVHQLGDDPTYDLRVDVEAVDPTKDFCTKEDGYAKDILSNGPVQVVEELEGFEVGEITKAPFGTQMQLAEIKTIYRSGYVEVDIISSATKNVLSTSIMPIRLLRKRVSEEE